MNTALEQDDNYKKMLKILDVKDSFNCDRKHFSWDGLTNKFNNKWKNIRQNLDYVLFRAKDKIIFAKNPQIRKFRKKWNSV